MALILLTVILERVKVYVMHLWSLLAPRKSFDILALYKSDYYYYYYYCYTTQWWEIDDESRSCNNVSSCTATASPSEFSCIRQLFVRSIIYRQLSAWYFSSLLRLHPAGKLSIWMSVPMYLTARISLQELIRRWDSERELLRSTSGRYANSLK